MNHFPFMMSEPFFKGLPIVFSVHRIENCRVGFPKSGLRDFLGAKEPLLVFGKSHYYENSLVIRVVIK